MVLIAEAEGLRFRYQLSSKRNGRRAAQGAPEAPEQPVFALDGLSFQVKEPSLVALLGPNGSGKSTLFRILTTMVAPGAGHARIQGFDTVRQAAKVRAGIGVVFQESGLDRKLTVRENLRFQGNLFGLSGSDLDERLREAARRMAIEDRLDVPVYTLSGGLRRRVEIAKALLHQPRLLLLDEPSTGLDPRSRRDLWKYLRELHDELGVAVIAATHYLDEAERCHRVLILHEGRLVADGEPSALKQGVGGDVLVLESDEAERLLEVVRQYPVVTATLADGSLRVETPDSAGLVTWLMASHAKLIRELRLHAPTLDDVYFRVTGKEFQP
ncbi:MAG: ABC transporter ATP-binding protein [Bryobacterales bacterium]|nr:ABC transporter ATP-binding protein [Bryobacterales bacterium]